MPRIESFEKYSKEYDEWFTQNRELYIAELNLIKDLIPSNKLGVEIGVGTGRFAAPLGIKIGIDPSKMMTKVSMKRDIQVYRAVAENLPFKDDSFDFGLMITTICFVDDLSRSLRESYRILKPKGFVIIGFVDKESELGKRYQAKRARSKFYGDATFYSVPEVMNYLKKVGFKITDIKQTIFPSKINMNMDSVKNGYGEGSFVVIKAVKTVSGGEK